MPDPSPKTDWQRLALFGAAPASAAPLHVNRPNAGDRAAFARLADGIWQSRWFTNGGPLIDRFEAALADRLGVRHAVAMASGTAALAVLVDALGLSGEVILPSYTFVSSPHVLARAGLTPVFCDVRRADWNIDAQAAARLVTPRTSAILATHVWGRAAQVEALERLAGRHGLQLIFDAAHAFGCTHRARPIGGLGRAEVFSFQANKAFHCGEGGAVTTNDDALAEKLRRGRNFGFVGFDRVDGIGTNAKLPELSAALGLVNLDAFDGHAARAAAVWQRYAAVLDGVPGFALLPYAGPERANHQYVVGLVDAACPLTRDRIVDILHAENVLARRYFYPGCHRMAPYDRLYPGAKDRLPVTEDIAARVLVLPGGAAISDAAVDLVAGLMRRILGQAGAIAARLDKAA